MDFKLQRLPEYDDQSLLQELRRVAELHADGPLTRSLFARHSRASTNTYLRRFGSWAEALDAAGLAARYGGPAVTDRMRQQPGKQASESELIADLQRVAQLVQSTHLTVDDYAVHGSFPITSVRKYFKLWRQALEVAGLRVGANSRRYTDEECFENLSYRVDAPWSPAPAPRNASESLNHRRKGVHRPLGHVAARSSCFRRTG
jgi:hypothetical protein